jgi:hypothetical protein
MEQMKKSQVSFVIYLFVMFLLMIGFFIFLYKVAVPFFTGPYLKNSIDTINNELKVQIDQEKLNAGFSNYTFIEFCDFDFATGNETCYQQPIDLTPEEIGRENVYSTLGLYIIFALPIILVTFIIVKLYF